MNKTPVVFFHGFGVRGQFWSSIVSVLKDEFEEIYTPNLDMTDLPSLINSANNYLKALAEQKGPLYLAGHSLGGVTALLSAKELGPDIIKKAVALAPPYGISRTKKEMAALRLLRLGLIPDFICRSSFFGPETPKSIQRSFFSKTVKESPSMQKSIFQEKWFHVDLLKEHVAQPVLVVASGADRIVKAENTTLLGEKIGAEILRLPEERGIGHDDYVASPSFKNEMAAILTDFFLKETSSK